MCIGDMTNTTTDAATGTVASTPTRAHRSPGTSPYGVRWTSPGMGGYVDRTGYVDQAGTTAGYVDRTGYVDQAGTTAGTATDVAVGTAAGTAAGTTAGTEAGTATSDALGTTVGDGVAVAGATPGACSSRALGGRAAQ